MPYGKLAEDILNDWRAAERELATVDAHKDERLRLEKEIERLRDEYHASRTKPPASIESSTSRPIRAALSDADHTTTDTDQTAADADQAASDRDQAASDSDDIHAAMDQRQSDRDQARSDRQHAEQQPSARPRRPSTCSPGTSARRRPAIALPACGSATSRRSAALPLPGNEIGSQTIGTGDQADGHEA